MNVLLPFVLPVLRKKNENDAEEKVYECASSENESIYCFTLIFPNAQDQQHMFYVVHRALLNHCLCDFIWAWEIEQFEGPGAKREKRRNGWKTGRCEI
ncbi:uncharacterized protein MONOS_17569 [Monocercomonoides exilis]|uniref:uncharacterized protein n=1 Tax=Monocercomonoides exilis TaxID=2049356 RepID=UPI0035593D8C|nr:hypothetical protein MONOS_17569 [Monocercomonoides exilis]